MANPSSTPWAICPSQTPVFGWLLDVAFEVGELTRLHNPMNRRVDPEVEQAFEPAGADGLVAANHGASYCFPGSSSKRKPQSPSMYVGGRGWDGSMTRPRRSLSPRNPKNRPGSSAATFQAFIGPPGDQADQVVSNGEVLPLGMDLADTGATSVVEAIPMSTIPLDPSPSGRAKATPDPVVPRS